MLSLIFFIYSTEYNMNHASVLVAYYYYYYYFYHRRRRRRGDLIKAKTEYIPTIGRFRILLPQHAPQLVITHSDVRGILDQLARVSQIMARAFFPKTKRKKLPVF